MVPNTLLFWYSSLVVHTLSNFPSLRIMGTQAEKKLWFQKIMHISTKPPTDLQTSAFFQIKTF